MDKATDGFGLLLKWQDEIKEAMLAGCDRKIGPYPCCSVVEGDCLELMKALPDECVDAVITDPPYGIAFDYGTDYKDSKRDYPELMNTLVSESSRISPCWAIFQAAKNAPKWGAWFGDNFRLIALPKLFGQWMPCHIQWRTDYVLLSGGVQTGNRKWETIYEPRDFFQSSAVCVTNGPNARPDHPCPRPIDSMMFLVETIVPRGGTVIDPFFGSGTTGVAARRLERHFLGFEREPKYITVARKRLAEIDAQPSLFEPQPVQERLL